MSKEETANRVFSGVVIGASAGGGKLLAELLSKLPVPYRLPILIARHVYKHDEGLFGEFLAGYTQIPVCVPYDKTPIETNRVYAAPPDYHMLVEPGNRIALSVDDKVRWSRPSIDVLFESAARVWKNRLVAVVYSGANSDGARGLSMVAALGGIAVVQDPETAEYPEMPLAAISAVPGALVYPPEIIVELLKKYSLAEVPRNSIVVEKHEQQTEDTDS